MILGLDISTSCTGWCVLDDLGRLVSIGYIDLKKEKNAFKKAKIVQQRLSNIHISHEIKKIFIEENLQTFRSGFSSAKTLSTLARFNGIVSFICYEEFKRDPEFLNVNSSRRSLGIKIQKEKDCGKSTKQQVLEWVSISLGDTGHKWPIKTLKSGPRKGQDVLEGGCYDMADAYVIAKAGIEMNI